MSEKYEDLLENIENDDTFDMTRSELVGARVALQWLDQNRDQAPGRTITESQIAEAFGDEYHYWAKRRLSRIGITVVPDPEPTNAEKLDKIMEEWPGRATASDPTFGEYLHNRGVKAPGGDE